MGPESLKGGRRPFLPILSSSCSLSWSWDRAQHAAAAAAAVTQRDTQESPRTYAPTSTCTSLAPLRATCPCTCTRAHTHIHTLPWVPAHAPHRGPSIPHTPLQAHTAVASGHPAQSLVPSQWVTLTRPNTQVGHGGTHPSLSPMHTPQVPAPFTEVDTHTHTHTQSPSLTPSGHLHKSPSTPPLLWAPTALIKATPGGTKYTHPPPGGETDPMP